MGCAESEEDVHTGKPVCDDEPACDDKPKCDDKPEVKKAKGTKKGVYWKVVGTDPVYYSKSGRKSHRVRKEGESFAGPEDFFEHRKNHGWSEDWEGVIEVPEMPADRDHSGMYWKVEGTDQVYFSKSKKRVQQDKVIENPEEYMQHRKDHGWPEDWEGIEELPEDFFPDTEVSRRGSKGVYWKYEGQDEVHYSKHGRYEGPIRSLSDNCAFADPDEFFEHREKHGWPKNWDFIREHVPEGCLDSESDSSSSDSD